MSKQDATVTKVPTALQQRLTWKPVKRAAFRQKGHFRVLFDTYCLASGKRYKIVGDSRRTTKFICEECKQGRCSLRIRRTSATSWWIVKKIVTCDCGKPPALLEDLKEDDLTTLVGRYVTKKSDWKLLACASFPHGYICDKSKSSDRWCISCKDVNCDGELNIELEWVGGGRKYDAFRITSAVDCSKQCKQKGGQSSIIPVKAIQKDNEVCPLCCNEESDEWVKFPCGKQTCRDCFEKLVQSCPSEISKRPNLSLFEPDRNPAHHHSCPFCKVAYSPQTKMQHHVRAEKLTARDVKVHDLVPTSYGYQSFNPEAPAYIATETEYHAMEIQYAAYLREAEANRRRESQIDAQRGHIPREELQSLLDAMAWDNFERLHTLRQSGHFLRHRHMVLNFVEAIEFLYERGLDGGFLRHVANTHDENQRNDLMQNAYEGGWFGEDDISPQLVINLLQRNRLVQVIDLVSSDDSDSDEEEV